MSKNTTSLLLYKKDVNTVIIIKYLFILSDKVTINFLQT